MLLNGHSKRNYYNYSPNVIPKESFEDIGVIVVDDNLTIDVVISGLRHNELLLTIPTTSFSSITPRPFIVSKVFINEAETSSYPHSL